MIALEGRAALAWRADRLGLGPVPGSDVEDVANRVIAVRGWPTEGRDLAFAVRQQQPKLGSVAAALEQRDLVCSYAFRGGSYVFTPEVAAILLAVRTTTRVWESARFQRQAGIEIDDWEPVRAAVLELLAEGPATRSEIAAHLRGTAALAHLAEAAASGAGSDSLYKPMHWWGDICFGPPREGVSTFRVLRDDARWPGWLDVDEAGEQAVAQYLQAYGPATTDNLQYWLKDGLSAPGRRVLRWLADLGDAVSEVRVDGVPAFAWTATLDELAAAEPSDRVVLLPGFDPWVMGPGTADPLIVAGERRALLSRGSAVVLRGGVVVGTWRRRGSMVEIAWFPERGDVPEQHVEDAVRRLGNAVGVSLSLTFA